MYRNKIYTRYYIEVVRIPVLSIRDVKSIARDMKESGLSDVIIYIIARVHIRRRKNQQNPRVVQLDRKNTTTLRETCRKELSREVTLISTYVRQCKNNNNFIF